MRANIFGIDSSCPISCKHGSFCLHCDKSLKGTTELAQSKCMVETQRTHSVRTRVAVRAGPSCSMTSKAFFFLSLFRYTC